MTRRFYIRATAMVASLFVGGYAVTTITDPMPRIIWNASASVPIGFYRITPDRDPPVGALVAIAPPERLARWMVERGYLGEDVPLLKHVVGKPGARVCRDGSIVSVDTRPLATTRANDRLGRPLPVWHGCRTLRNGELFLLNPDHPDSLDGRYFGLLPANAVLGRAQPILTRDAPGAPLEWRSGNP
ncbi:S26 family signal peptidase [Qipengyuania qiaonensis]|uniref:S26 family signal peptidase n=1 Tax=Qipengyuania qiaonensis TaxID=2867240 RepID=A0ABS7J3V7_9SPHN|nr:S26 family signal peptidase [Qipengyuania qiaonensis]MBX7482017.1 S26 family signal peptidase [Qipengyuania qiaonensis]